MNNSTTNRRIATVSDFKVGATLYTSENFPFTIMEKYDEGIWESRGLRGGNCIFENEARFYTVDK